jgi:hypothetical protein
MCRQARQLDQYSGVRVDRLGLAGAAVRPGPAADLASSSSVFQAKLVSTPRSRARPLTLAGGLTAAVLETTTH